MRMVFPNSTGRLLDEISTDVNAFFEAVMKENSDEKVDYAPLMDFEDRSDSYELSLDLPGVDPNDIHVDIEEDHVIIHGERHSPAQDDQNHRRRVERRFGAFRRVLRLPKQVDRDGVAANYEQGVLTVTVPKAAKNSRRIVVAHGAGSAPTPAANSDATSQQPSGHATDSPTAE